MIYDPEGKLVKQGSNPAMLDNPASTESGAGVSPESALFFIGAMVIAGGAFFLLVLTKMFGPRKKPAA